jgi:cholesterol transport system auxiliary component
MSPFKALAAAALALTLTGCISLLPKTDPAQLYRFEAASTAAAAPSTRPVFAVLKAPSSFVRASAGDGLLTLTDGQAAYIAGARWVSPAVTLFDEAVTRAFQDAGGPGRLIGRSEIARADSYLKLDVRTFETRYDQGSKAAPMVVIEVNAALTRTNQSLVGARTFTASIRASDNRVSAIVQAYDQAVGEVLGQLVAWGNASGGAT